MCVAQFRTYCSAFSHKLANDISIHDKVMPYEPLRGGRNGDLIYCCDMSKMKKLMLDGNEYAKSYLKGV